MSVEETERRFQCCVFISGQPRHFIEQGTFSMYYFVVGKHENVLFTQMIGQTEAELFMMKLLKIRVQFHIFQKVIHPSHIPFIRKSKTVVLNTFCDTRPRRRFFRNDVGIRMTFFHNAV